MQAMTESSTEPDTTTDPDEERRAAYVASLRALADFYETTDLPAPLSPVKTYLYCDPDEFPRRASALGGDRTKDTSDDYFAVIRSFGPWASVQVYSERAQVCERKVIGVEKVQIPDPDAPLVTVEREVVEWECPPSVLDLDARARGIAGVAELRQAATDARREAVG